VDYRAEFIAGLDGNIVIDELQRAPELFLAIKAEVDRNCKPGRFLLTGSANVMLLRKHSESLAGRMEILTLWPLSQGEIEGVGEGFIDAVFGDKLPSLSKTTEDRTQTGQEVDIALENAAGKVVGIETKASKSVNAQDFKGLQTMSESLGPRFHRGIVLYTGSEGIPFGKNMQALPVSALWTLGALKNTK
jgi:predicted AAA+ superfamily ATPase